MNERGHPSEARSCVKRTNSSLPCCTSTSHCCNNRHDRRSILLLSLADIIFVVEWSLLCVDSSEREGATYRLSRSKWGCCRTLRGQFSSRIFVITNRCIILKQSSRANLKSTNQSVLILQSAPYFSGKGGLYVAGKAFHFTFHHCSRNWKSNKLRRSDIVISPVQRMLNSKTSLMVILKMDRSSPINWFIQFHCRWYTSLHLHGPRIDRRVFKVLFAHFINSQRCSK